MVRGRLGDIAAWLGRDAASGSVDVVALLLPLACDALAQAIEAGAVPPAGISVLTRLYAGLEDHGIPSAAALRLSEALGPHLCLHCCLRPPTSPWCEHCQACGCDPLRRFCVESCEEQQCSS